jgi:hypothetical protein
MTISIVYSGSTTGFHKYLITKKGKAESENLDHGSGTRSKRVIGRTS